MSASEREELFKTLVVEIDRLVDNIDPIDMCKIGKSLLFIAPRCLWCYRTEAHLDQNMPQLVCCRVCNGATYCSDEHKGKAETAHKTAVESGRTEVCYPTINAAAKGLTFLKTSARYSEWNS